MSDLHRAAANGDTKKLAKLIKDGANPTICSATGHSPLDLAAASENFEAVKILAKAIVRTNPHAADAALSRAVVRGQPRVAAALLDAGADPTAREPATSRTPLHWAAFAGDDALCDCLLRAGAEAGAADVTGATPGDWAADRGHASLALRLAARAAADRRKRGGGGGGGGRGGRGGGGRGGRRRGSGKDGFLDRVFSGVAVAALAATAAAAVFAAHRLPQQRAAARAAAAAAAKKKKKSWW